MRIGILGTGVVGQTLAGKLREFGHEVVIGSRTAGEGKRPFAEAAAHGELLINATGALAAALPDAGHPERQHSHRQGLALAQRGNSRVMADPIELVHEAEQKVEDLAHEAAEGSSARTPAIAITGVALVIAAVAAVMIVVVFVLYYAAK